jgi:hypothetical protein
MKIIISRLITIFILLLFALLVFSLGAFIAREGKGTMDFCKEQRINQTFMDTMRLDGDVWNPSLCDSSQWRTGWGGYCNSTCFENYDKCLEENATSQQIRFSEQCHWMGPEYFILAGIIAFKFVFPISLLIPVWIAIKQFFKKEEDEDGESM